VIPAVVNHLWQSTAFGLGIVVLTFFLRRSSARLRFRLWLTASMKFLVPFAILSMLSGWLAPAALPGVAPRIIGMAAEPFAQLAPGGPVVKDIDLAPIFDPTPWLCGLWGAGAAGLLAFWLLKWRKVATIVRSSRPLPWVGPLPVRLSTSVCEPWLVGIRRPMVLLPATMVQHFQPDEIDAILAHEACHRRRFDNLWAGLHMVVAALFWFHPLVWWIGRRLIEERERACDEAVVQAGHSREIYARAILETCRQYFRSPLACVSGALGANLTQRVEAIMLAPSPRPATPREKVILFAAGLMALAAPLLGGVLASPSASAPNLSSWLYAGPSREQIAHDLAEQQRPRTAVRFDPTRFDRYVGNYQATPSAIITVFRRGDRFLTQMPGQKAAEIYPEAGAKFFYKAMPAQISFVTGNDGKTAALIVHQNGWNVRMPKLDDRAAARLRAALASRIAASRPSPGTEGFVRRWLAAATANYGDMSPALARDARQQLPQARFMLWSFGALKAVRFLRVSPQGADLYEADFDNGRLFVRVPPLVGGKAASLFARPLSGQEQP